jgi:hypothetical protein
LRSVAVSLLLKQLFSSSIASYCLVALPSIIGKKGKELLGILILNNRTLFASKQEEIG